MFFCCLTTGKQVRIKEDQMTTIEQGDLLSVLAILKATGRKKAWVLKSEDEPLSRSEEREMLGAIDDLRFVVTRSCVIVWIERV